MRKLSIIVSNIPAHTVSIIFVASYAPIILMTVLDATQSLSIEVAYWVSTVAWLSFSLFWYSGIYTRSKRDEERFPNSQEMLSIGSIALVSLGGLTMIPVWQKNGEAWCRIFMGTNSVNCKARKFIGIYRGGVIFYCDVSFGTGVSAYRKREQHSRA